MYKELTEGRGKLPRRRQRQRERRSEKIDERKNSPQIDRRLAPKRTILRGIHGCVSPRCSASTFRSSFSWFEQDAWTYISRFLDGKSLVMLGATSKWFHKTVMEDSIWRFACLRDLQVPKPFPVSSSWIKIYASAFDGSHSYLFHQQEKHIDWMRIGAFTLESRVSLLTERLSSPLKVPREGTIEQMLQSTGSCIIKDIKSGIWIADLQLVRCPVCDLSTCDGTMQTLDARHIELFLNEGYKMDLGNTISLRLISCRRTQRQLVEPYLISNTLKHLHLHVRLELNYSLMFLYYTHLVLKMKPFIGILNLKSWTGAPDDSQPKAMVTPSQSLFIQDYKKTKSSTCGHTGFSLLCTDRHETVLKLPNSGLFLIRDIDYEKQRIRLNDPNNCIHGSSASTLRNLLSPLHLLNHTILTCPNEDIKSSSHYKPIRCLGKSTSSSLATVLISRVRCRPLAKSSRHYSFLFLHQWPLTSTIKTSG
ncbi:hypothetical protein Bca52824_008144 [Brassica carinata]|uniref:Wall-associated receptor kinase galacturonan-binding domain-containing protein n=1 Tax=Brassica carinata TaxID=52824 RepID=A0A8X7W8F6_BRACI|nr:hypothetical protein Bca52824_008144 [Brassica carinata]